MVHAMAEAALSGFSYCFIAPVFEFWMIGEVMRSVKRLGQFCMALGTQGIRIVPEEIGMLGPMGIMAGQAPNLVFGLILILPIECQFVCSGHILGLDLDGMV
jgi:hypothetical protein